MHAFQPPGNDSLSSQFLTGPIRRGLEFISLDEIRSKTLAGADDILVVAGSIVEGMGNLMSDVDVCVVTDAPPTIEKIKTCSHYVIAINDPGKELRERLKLGRDARKGVIDPGLEITNSYELLDDEGTRCDVEYISYAELQKMVDKIHREYEFAGRMHGGLGEALPLRQMRFIHRLMSGVALTGRDRLSEIFSSELRKKASYLQFRNALVPYSDFQDIVGAFFAERWDQLVFQLRDYIHKHLKAFTHLCGNTNPVDKWVVTYAERLFGEKSELVLSYRRLHRETSVTDDKARSYLLDCLDFCDSIYQKMIDHTDSRRDIYPNENNQEILRSRIKHGEVKDPHIFIGMEYHSKPFNRKATRSRDFLLMRKGLQTCSFI
jgi:hypothetical protein